MVICTACLNHVKDCDAAALCAGHNWRKAEVRIKGLEDTLSGLRFVMQENAARLSSTQQMLSDAWDRSATLALTLRQTKDSVAKVLRSIGPGDGLVFIFKDIVAHIDSVLTTKE